MLPVGPILLTILLVMICFGLVDGVLGRMGVNSRQAGLMVAAMLAGLAFDIDLAPGLSVNVGGGVVPMGVALYLTLTAGSWEDSARALGAVLATAGAVYLVGRWFPPGEPTELNLFLMDAQYLYGLTGGLVGFTAGRARRPAFAAGVLGVLLADLTHYLGYLRDGLRLDLLVHLGGGGFWATTMMAGALALLVAEFVGETREAKALEEQR
ncbi:MAG: hypothetical protein K0R39_4096 [Symbiobacteriaceae bacterium]|nr:hypothetical protein [Symbiobacteriaceae bacterium]